MPFCNGITPVFGPDQRFDLFARALDIPQFHTKQHDVDGTDGHRIVGRLYRVDQRLAAVALDPQPVFPHRGQVRAACQEGHTVPPWSSGFGERRAKASADTTRADYRDPA